MTTPSRPGRTARRGRGFLLALAAVCVMAGPASAAETPAEPEGYRMGRYRAAVPASLRGATAISTAEARALWDSGAAVFVDVLPRPPKPEGLPEGTIWRPRPRYDIPGSVWLPNTGFGALNPEVEAYFRDNLARLTGGDKNVQLVFYCLAKCWMSWNAGKRALSHGYRRVLWYPEGSDGWHAEGGELQKTAPVPMAP